jgi:hypothetical protein
LEDFASHFIQLLSCHDRLCFVEFLRCIQVLRNGCVWSSLIVSINAECTEVRVLVKEINSTFLKYPPDALGKAIIRFPQAKKTAGQATSQDGWNSLTDRGRGSLLG